MTRRTNVSAEAWLTPQSSRKRTFGTAMSSIISATPSSTPTIPEQRDRAAKTQAQPASIWRGFRRPDSQGQGFHLHQLRRLDREDRVSHTAERAARLAAGRPTLQ